MSDRCSCVSKLNPAWVEQTRREFLEFLEATHFPHPQRNGARGSRFDYPEWLIMLIAVLSVKCRVQSYLGIHRLVVQYWPQLAPDPLLPAISESQLRERLKKISHTPGKPAGFVGKSFLQKTWPDTQPDTQPDKAAKVSADKMMVRARGPVWHQKQKKQGIVPARLRALDKEATWSFSRADGWVYGHGTFCLTSHDVPFLGCFLWMQNSGHEAKVMQREIGRYSEEVGRVFMDSKADDQKLYFALQRQGIQLVTSPRKGADKSPLRKKMLEEMQTPQNLHDYKHRSPTVEPMQGLMKDIFDLERCWMRGEAANRWLFAATGIAVQIAQTIALKNNRSTWNIKHLVLGL